LSQLSHRPQSAVPPPPPPSHPPLSQTECAVHSARYVFLATVLLRAKKSVRPFPDHSIEPPFNPLSVFLCPFHPWSPPPEFVFPPRTGDRTQSHYLLEGGSFSILFVFQLPPPPHYGFFLLTPLLFQKFLKKKSSMTLANLVIFSVFVPLP